MKDIMVSIRMPNSLADELQTIAKKEGFLDISELVRSVARKKWLEHTKPELAQLEGLRKGIETELQKVTQKRIQQEVSEELKKIRDQLRKGGVQ